MIDSAQIENFRCFESANAQDLGLINVVVGDNAAGKTTLLEALYLLATNSPEAHLKLLGWRQAAPSVLKSARFNSGEFWLDLFHRFERDRQVSIQVKGDPSRSLKIYFREDQEDVVGGEQKAPIVFSWDVEGVEGVFKSEPTYKEGEVSFPSAPGSVISGAFLNDRMISDLPQRYTQLDVDDKSDLVDGPIRREFPEIESLSVGAESAGDVRVYAKLQSNKRKIPLALVSAGIHRLTYILATIAAYSGGSIFVDEFAHGIYHERLSRIWKAVHSLAAEQQTQVFLTTHSGEALAALQPTIAEHEEDFRLIRVKRDRTTGRSTLSVSAGENLAAAIETHVEVR